MVKTLYLPGAVGRADFWQPAAHLIGGSYELLSWPGLGDEKPNESINSLDDLIDLTCEQIDQPVNLIAQSMGGYVAIKTALRHPDKVRRLVLTVTSGGVDVSKLGGSDWRADYRTAFPNAARWIEQPTEDLSELIQTLHIPTLLIWGDDDPISPLAIGKHLESLLPDARLEIIEGGDHDLAKLHSEAIAALIQHHLD